jgi:caffeoyl-CoA O-methyltransferase
MEEIVPEAIESYCEKHTRPEPEVFRALAKETYAKMEIPQMQVGHLEGSFLRLLVSLTGAKQVLEIGTFTGYSALMMAEGLPEGGALITCDVDPDATSVAQKYWSQSPHGKKIQLKLGPALDTLPRLEGPFDLVFIDADKVNYIHYYEACLPKVRKGGLIVADNVLWSGRVLDPKEESDQAIVAFNRHVIADPRVEPVMLTVRDGMYLIQKK